MVKPYHIKTLLITMTFMVIVSLLTPMPAFADDDLPPTPTEEPVQPPIDEASATEIPAAVEDVYVDEILSQVPDETEVVVINESGHVEPLATQQAADIILSGDPIWCRDNVSPDPLDVANCTSSYTSLQDLLDYLALNQPTSNGTIWIEANYDSSINDVGVIAFTLDGAALTTWAAHSLTIQGGWNGISDSAVVDSSDPSQFNGASLTIINWGNTITISDILITNAAGDSLTVTTTGDIVLHNLQANNADTGAHLDNTSGNGDITLTGKTTFKNNANLGLFLSSCGVISIHNLTANNNGAGAAIGNGCASNFGLEGIKFTGKNSFSGNDSFGLYVQSKGNISLQSISASGNGFFGAVLDTCIWNPNTQFCAGIGNIVLSGANTFNDNAGGVLAGLNVFSGGMASLTNITSIGNSGDGIYLEMAQPSVIKLGCVKRNGGYGILSFGGVLTLKDTVVHNNSLDNVRALSGKIIFDSDSNDCSPEGNEVENVGLPIHYVQTTGSQTVTLDCDLFSGTVLILPNSDSAYFPCPLSDSASLTSFANSDLSGVLPNGTQYSSGFITTISSDGENRDPVNEFIRISFKIPNGVASSDLAILYWDGSQWVELSNGLTLENGRIVALGGSVSTDGLYFEALVNFTGTFVLVRK